MAEDCIACLRRSFVGKKTNREFIKEVEHLLENRKESSAPEIVYYYNQIHRKYYGDVDETKFISIKSEYNQLVLSRKKEIQERIRLSRDPLFESLLLARIGNYIDFSAFSRVDPADFLDLLFHYSYSDLDKKTYTSFCEACARAKTFLLLADNCGEIVLDQIFIQELKIRFPQMDVYCMVRGGLVSNDATMEDAMEIGLDKDCKVITNGMAVAGTIYNLLGTKEKKIMEEADVILSKGQANYESVHGDQFHVFYSFLCKCEMFQKRFSVPALTGMFVEE